MRQLCLLVCCLTACGDDGVRHTPDAAPHDGPRDSAIDGALDPVTVTAMRDGAPASGVHVYFQDADSTVVLATTTDANGTASAVMAPGGYVTAVDPFAVPLLGAPRSNELATYVGVKPGDHLVLSNGDIETAITVTVTAVPDPAGAATYLYSSCLPGGTQLTGLSLVAVPVARTVTLSDCGATAGFLLVSRDQNNQVLNTAFVADVPVVDQGTVDLSAATWVAADPKTWTFTNEPALTALDVQDDLVDAQGTVFSTSFETPSDAQDPTMTIPVPAFAGATEIISTTIFTASIHGLVDWGPYTSTYSVDVGARMLADFTSAPTYDPAAHTVSITEAATGGVADFISTVIHAERASDGRQWDWNIAAPHATTITLPALPTDVYDFNIAATDAVDVELWGAAKVPGGYDAVRPHVFTSSGGQELVTELGANGSIALVQYLPLATDRPASRVTMGNHAPALFARVLSRRVR
jgi:hypothetical protein